MVRSGWVSSISRASAPAITSPEGVTDTTLGTIPERILGPVNSITATRLLVVPRSIPTIFDSVFPKSIWKGDIQFLPGGAEVVREVSMDIQEVACRTDQCRPHIFVPVVQLEQPSQCCIGFFSHLENPFIRYGYVRPNRFIAAP